MNVATASLNSMGLTWRTSIARSASERVRACERAVRINTHLHDDMTSLELDVVADRLALERQHIVERASARRQRVALARALLRARDRLLDIEARLQDDGQIDDLIYTGAY